MFPSFIHGFSTQVNSGQPATQALALNQAGNINSNQALPLNLTTIHEVLQPLDASNWMQARSDMLRDQPNLHKAYSVIDIQFPRQAEQISNIGPFQIATHDQATGYEPVWVRVTKQDHFFSKSVINSIPGVFSKHMQRMWSNGRNMLNHPDSFQNRNEQVLPRPVALLKVIEYFLTNKVSKSDMSLIRTESGKLDLNDCLLKALVRECLGSITNPEPTPINFSDHLKPFFKSTPKNNELVTELTQEQIEFLKQLPLQVIELISLCDWLLLRSNSNQIGQVELPVCNDLTDSRMRRTLTQNGKNYADTLCTFVQRNFRVEHIGPKEFLGLNQSPWLVRENDSMQAVATKAKVMEKLISLGWQQLHHLNINQANKNKQEELLPLSIYIALGRIIDQPIPNWIIEQFDLLNQNNETYQTEFAKKEKANHAVQLQKQAKKEQRQQASLAEVKQWADRLGVPAVEEYVQLASRGSSRDIANRTSDFRVVLTGDAKEALSTFINTNFLQLDMAHNRRGKESLATAAAGIERLTRDNRCWLRAAWLSVFEQTEPHTLGNHVEQAKLGQEGGLAYVEKEVKADLIALSKAYHKEPLVFLHRGEESRLLDSPVNFRTGQTLENCLNEFGIPIHSNQCRKSEVENILRQACIHLAVGIRENIRTAKDFSNPVYYSQATTDLPAAMHRALGVPAVFVEDSGEGQVSLRVVTPNNHVLKGALQPEDTTSSVIDNAEEINFILSNINFPIIHLQALPEQSGHYTLFTPRNSILGASVIAEQDKQLQKARINEEQRQQALQSNSAGPGIVLMESPTTRHEAIALLQLTKDLYPTKPLIVELNELSPANSKTKPTILPFKSLLSNRLSFNQNLIRIVTESSTSISTRRSAVLSTLQFKEEQTKQKVELLQLPFRKTQKPSILANDLLDALEAMYVSAPNEGYVLVSPKGTLPAALFNALDSYIRHPVNQQGIDDFKGNGFNQKLLALVISQGPKQEGKSILLEPKAREVLETACEIYHQQQLQLGSEVET